MEALAEEDMEVDGLAWVMVEACMEEACMVEAIPCMVEVEEVTQWAEVAVEAYQQLQEVGKPLPRQVEQLQRLGQDRPLL